MNPHQVTADFERAVAQYTGAPFCVAVNSCTSALLLACHWHLQSDPREDRDWDHRHAVSIPKRTYVGVPCSIIHAGGRPTFRDEDWRGYYQLQPFPLWDSARWFTSDLYRLVSFEGNGMVCVSFHASKNLGLEQGGAILLDDADADRWLRRMRFDGRIAGIAPADQVFSEVGFHCYMNPSTAAQGLLRLHSFARDQPKLPNDPYPDLSQMEIFKQ